MDLTPRVESLEQGYRELQEILNASLEAQKSFEARAEEHERQMALTREIGTQMLKVLAASAENQVKFERKMQATQAEWLAAHNAVMADLDIKMKETTDKLNGLIAVVDDMIRRGQ